jgi:exopolysaccharide biosynthesis polyprenyl glycosylphosphotransferase
MAQGGRGVTQPGAWRRAGSSTHERGLGGLKTRRRSGSTVNKGEALEGRAALDELVAPGVRAGARADADPRVIDLRSARPHLVPGGGLRPARFRELKAATERAILLGRLSAIVLFIFDTIFLVVAANLTGVHRSAAVPFVVLVLLACCLTRSYRERISPMVGEEVPVLVARLAVPTLIVGSFLADGADVQAVLHAALLSCVGLFAGRLTIYALIRRSRRNGALCEPTLILGAGQQAMVMAKTLADHPEYGLIPVGFVDDVDDELDPPIVAKASELDALLEGGWIRRIIVAFGSTRESDLVGVLRSAEHHRVEVHVMPRFFELGVVPLAGYTDVIWGIPLSQVRRSALRNSARRPKRVVDVLVALVLLALAAPVMTAIAMLIKLTSPGPVLFRQARVGQRANPVHIYKFRTLPVNNDADRTWSVEKDPRVSRLGRFLRRTSLDELPQLVNVLRGDMSIVGPRPERPMFVDEFDRSIPRYGDRHRVPVGMTGWAQIHRLRGDTSIEERARFDNFYIENWSLWRDLLIMIRTLPAMVLRPRHSRSPGVDARVTSPGNDRDAAGEEAKCNW